MAAIRRMPPSALAGQRGAQPLAETVLDASLRAMPAAERTGPAFVEAVGFGRELAARLPAAERQAMHGAARRAAWSASSASRRSPAQMKFDLSRFTVAAGEEVVIEFVNQDQMPHNLVVGKEGALETVGLAAEAMVALPDAFAKNFVPATPEVLFSIRLLNPARPLQAALHGADAARQLSVRLHVPGPLAHDERHRRGAGRRQRRSPSHDTTRPRLRPRRALIAGALPRRRRRRQRRTRAPHVVFVTGDDEYRSEITMPMIAAILEKQHGMRTSVAYAQADSADQGPHRGTRGARDRRPDGHVHALPGAARRPAEPDPGLREVGQADGRPADQHA